MKNYKNMSKPSLMVDCWNCGRSYSSDEHEACPSCDEYPSNNPALIEEEIEWEEVVEEGYPYDDEEDDIIDDDDE